MLRFLTVLTVLFGCALVRADQVLFDFSSGFDAKVIAARNAKAAVSKGVLRLETFHKESWPGITLPAPQGKWDLSRFESVRLEVKNVGRSPASLNCRVDNPKADGTNHCIRGAITLNPGESGTLSVNLPRRLPADIKLFGMRGYPGGGTEKKGPSFDPANVDQLILFVGKPTEDCVFEVGNIRAAGTAASPVDTKGKPFFPFIDTYGQYIHGDWPGKVRSPEDLQKYKAEEEKDIAARPGPSDWSRYGGYGAGPALKATGFFRVEKHQGKWWIVDPEGKLFFSHGIDCVRASDATPIEERENWFADFPGNQPEFKEFFGKQFALHGHYAGRHPRGFNFGGATLKRKYGPEWRSVTAELAHRRLRSWGMNTIANWSDPSITQLRKTPYTATVSFTSPLLEGSKGYWGKFRDVFNPEFKPAIRKAMAAQAGKAAGDPWCLGFYVDNELGWGDETSLALAALQSPADQPAKRAFLEDLKAKYTTIDKLNAAWGTTHASWDALLASQDAPDKNKAKDDLAAFYTRTAETYFRTIRDAVREAAPGQLYLGCRFAWVNSRAVAAAVKYCDIVSYNLYRKSIADFKLPVDADVPLIVGEFHFGALDRGMFHTGLVKTASQAERAAAYKDYVQGALRHPQFVGTHWFKYQDQPTTGRTLDGENYQIGFVSNVDTPHSETIEASREVGYGMYRYRLEK